MSVLRRQRIQACFAAVVGLTVSVATSWAEVKLVTIKAPESTAWVGQRVTLTVGLRAEGPFVGAASFTLPEIPRCVIVKVGNPVVSSEEEGDRSWFVQTHEFALFSQADGTIEIPSFEIRFSSREGFTGPEQDHVEKTSPLKLEIKRPPGSDANNFLVTTDEIEITERWDPAPTAAKLGDVFHRTITQEAQQMTGMALAPPPTGAPAGVRVYPGKPEVADKTERGAFLGIRKDTLTYVLQEPGSVTLPAIKYVWWDPEKKQFGSKTLPAVTFDVAPAAIDNPVEQAETPDVRWLILAATVALLGVAWLVGRRAIGQAGRKVHDTLHPPDRVAARALIKACRHNDAPAAESAWQAWRATQPGGGDLSPPLRTAATDLARHLYGAAPAPAWRGADLATAFRQSLAVQKSHRKPTSHDLPALNP